ncbi:MAG: hypothetical protein WCG21_01680 [Eubacteriales bacterium]
MKNIDIRSQTQTFNIRLYEISERLGIRDSTFSRMLRYELSEDQKAEIRIAIDEIRKERASE